MIKKLKRPVKIGGTTFREKINELVDAVNEIMTWRFETDEDSEHKEQPADNSEKANCQGSVQDKFAEQRKWIGKLCKFWDIDNNNLYYGPLTKIHDTSPYCYECNHKMCYANCEPVSEDLIYKGDDNE